MLKVNKIRSVDVLSRITRKQKGSASTSKGLSGIDPNEDPVNFNDMLTIAGEAPDTQHFLDMFPDMVAASEIMITATLFPKDFSTMDVKYSFGDSNIPSAILFDILDEVKRIMEEEYKIKDILQKVAREELIGDGGVVKVVIPEGVVDKLMFNSKITVESINALFSNDGYGDHYLGKTSEGIRKPSMPEMPDKALDLIEVTDCVDYLRLPDIASNIQTTESIQGSGYKHIMKPAKLDEKAVLHLSNSFRDRKDVDKPLVITLHPRACRNIYPPGSPDKPVAHIIMLDSNGQPITKPSKYVSPEDKAKKFANSGVKRNSIASVAKTNIHNATKGDEDKVDDTFSKYLKELIVDRMNNGIFNVSEDIDIDLITQTTFARAMVNKKTKILVLPASMVTYFAMDYDNTGIAVNKISRLSVLCSMRGLLLFSALGNAVANNSEQLKVIADIDEDTADVDKVMKNIKRAVMNMNEAKLPVGISNPRDYIQWQQRTGVTFVFRNHPDLPKTEIQFERETRDSPSETDTVLLEDIRKQLLLAIGPGPDIVDNGFDNNTATETEANKVLFGKKGEQLKRPLLEQGSDFARKILLAHGEFFMGCEVSLAADDSVFKLFKEETKIQYEADNGKDETKTKKEDGQEGEEESDPVSSGPDLDRNGDNFKYFVNRLVFDLIRTLIIDIPTQAIANKAETLNDELSAFQSWLEIALPAWISEDMLDSETVGEEVGDNLRVLIDAYKAYFTREFLMENRMLVDLEQIVKSDALGQPTINIGSRIGSHNDTITHTFKEVIDMFKATVKDVTPKEPEPAVEPEPEPVKEPEEEEDTPGAKPDGSEADDDDDFTDDF